MNKNTEYEFFVIRNIETEILARKFPQTHPLSERHLEIREKNVCFTKRTLYNLFFINI